MQYFPFKSLSLYLAIPLFIWTLGDSRPKNGADLWEVSKTFIKNPFQWSTIWKVYPQTVEGLDASRAEAEQVEADYSKPVLPPIPRKSAATRAEELRWKTFLKKIDGLPLATESKPTPIPDFGVANNNTPEDLNIVRKHYFARNLAFASPYCAYSKSGKFYPDETSIQYSPQNESEIILLYEEVKIGRGANEGVKVGDLYRIYELGDVFHHFTSGRGLGKLITTQGIVKITRVNPKNAVGILVQCFGTISRDAKAAPIEHYQELTAQEYSPLPEAKNSAHVVYVYQQQQVPSPFSYLIIDEGSNKGFKMGDVVLIYNSANNKLTDKVLASAIVANVQNNSATLFIHDVYPGLINRGDFVVAVQSIKE